MGFGIPLRGEQSFEVMKLNITPLTGTAPDALSAIFSPELYKCIFLRNRAERFLGVCTGVADGRLHPEFRTKPSKKRTDVSPQRRNGTGLDPVNSPSWRTASRSACIFSA